MLKRGFGFGTRLSSSTSLSRHSALPKALRLLDVVQPMLTALFTVGDTAMSMCQHWIVRWWCTEVRSLARRLQEHVYGFQKGFLLCCRQGFDTI